MNKRHEGVLQTPRKINSKINILNHGMEKLMETKDKEKKLLKTLGRKEHVTSKETTMKLTSVFSTELMGPEDHVVPPAKHWEKTVATLQFHARQPGPSKPKAE